MATFLIFIAIYLLGAVIAYGRTKAAYAARDGDEGLRFVFAALSWVGVGIGVGMWFNDRDKDERFLRFRRLQNITTKAPYDFENKPPQHYIWQ